MNYEETIIVPPCTDAVKGMIDAEGMTLKKAIAELVVNSIDHHATEINLKLDANRDTLVISDNGSGPPEGLGKLIEIGRHVASKGHPVGRYGVGHKDATCWLADVSEIAAMTADGAKESLRADWQAILRLGSWAFRISHDSMRLQPGLTVRLSELRKGRLRYWKDVPRYISELFSAAIDDGVAIIVDGETIKSIPVPALESRTEFKGELNGLHFKGFAGILKDKTSAVSGWDVRYGPQSIATGYAKEGFGKHNSQGFYGRFEMLESTRPWHLTRNKTDSDDLYDILNSDHMQEVIKPLLKQIKERGDTLKISMNGRAATATLTNIFKRARASAVAGEVEDAPKPNKPREITVEELLDEPEPPQPPGQPRGPRPPRPLVPRERRRHDGTSDTRALIQRVQSIRIFPHPVPDKKGLTYVEHSERTNQVTIFIDGVSEFGKRIWESSQTIQHYAVVALAAHFASEFNLRGQMFLSIGDLGDSLETRIGKTLSYLLKHAEPEEFFATNGVKP